MNINNFIKKLVFIFLFLLILMIGYYVDLHYQGHRFLRAREQTSQLEKHLKQTHQRIAQTDQIQNILSQTRAKFNQAKITLPNLVDSQTFMNTVIQSGEKQGLKFLTVSPGSSMTKDFYHMIPVQLVILGTYQQFSNFLKLINTQHYFISINHFAMTRQQPAETTVLKNNNNTPDMLTINVTADFYYD